MKPPPLRSFQVENFKAIQDSGPVEMGWLTAFIGNNGAGKSSLIEGLETLRDVVAGGIDEAFAKWRGFEHVLNKSRERKLLRKMGHRPGYDYPMKFVLNWGRLGKLLKFTQSITQAPREKLQGPRANSLFIQRETIFQTRNDRRERWTRSAKGVVTFQGERAGSARPETFESTKYGDGESMLKLFTWESFDRWQFLTLSPDRMGQPALQQRAAGEVTLAKDGSNIAEYLGSIQRQDPIAYEGLLRTLRQVIPYATDIQPAITSELERSFYLKLREAQFEVPGWLLSTGTLRIVAILACLRHPKPPLVLVIEEIENGLDPRTLRLLVEEIRMANAAGTTQVIVTTHSPYFLDLLELSHIVVVEREDGQAVFRKPDGKLLLQWAQKFTPGRLYTMGRLTRQD